MIHSEQQSLIQLLEKGYLPAGTNVLQLCVTDTWCSFFLDEITKYYVVRKYLYLHRLETRVINNYNNAKLTCHQQLFKFKLEIIYAEHLTTYTGKKIKIYIG